MRFLTTTAFVILALIFVPLPALYGQSPPAEPFLVENFDASEIDGVPDRWGHAERDGKLHPMDRHMDDNQRFYIVEEEGERFLRGYTKGEAQRISIAANGEQDGIEWNLHEYPRLRWQWRALELPEGAREDRRRLNDTAGAVYVTFNTDWLGRPRSIKYTYSSTLPVGTVVDFGVLKVIVAASGEDGHGEWRTTQRDVMQDYENVFGGTPPEVPLSITLWTDSTETGSSSKVDFDNIYVLPPVQAPNSN